MKVEGGQTGEETASLELENFLPYRLNRLADAVSREFARIYKNRFGLTRPEWRLLATLGQYGTMTATAVGAHSSMHKTKVSRAVTALEQRKWLVRETSETDRRIEHLRLTKFGAAAYRELVPLAKAFEKKLSGAMGAARMAEFDFGLERMEEFVLDMSKGDDKTVR